MLAWHEEAAAYNNLTEPWREAGPNCWGWVFVRPFGCWCVTTERVSKSIYVDQEKVQT